MFTLEISKCLFRSVRGSSIVSRNVREPIDSKTSRLGDYLDSSSCIRVNIKGNTKVQDKSSSSCRRSRKNLRRPANKLVDSPTFQQLFEKLEN